MIDRRAAKRTNRRRQWDRGSELIHFYPSRYCLEKLSQIALINLNRMNSETYMRSGRTLYGCTVWMRNSSDLLREWLDRLDWDESLVNILQTSTVACQGMMNLYGEDWFHLLIFEKPMPIWKSRFPPNEWKSVIIPFSTAWQIALRPGIHFSGSLIAERTYSFFIFRCIEKWRRFKPVFLLIY